MVDKIMSVFPVSVGQDVSTRSRPSAPPILGIEFFPCVSNGKEV